MKASDVGPSELSLAEKTPSDQEVAEAEASAAEVAGQELNALRAGKIGPLWRSTLGEIASRKFQHLDRSRNHPRPTRPMGGVWLLIWRWLLGAVPFIVVAARLYPQDAGKLGSTVAVLAWGAFLMWRSLDRGFARPSRALLKSLRADLEGGVVLSEPAKVDVVDWRYVSQVGGRALVMTTSAADALRGCFGAHRAFFLPRSGVVLAVESMIADGDYRSGAPGARRSIDRAIASELVSAACRFKPEWTAANRAGRLAPGQWLAVFRGYFADTLEIALGAIVIRFLFVCSWGRVGAGAARRNPSGDSTVDTVWLGLVVFPLLLFIAQHLVRVAIAVARGRVQTSGRVSHANEPEQDWRVQYADLRGEKGVVVRAPRHLAPLIFEEAHYHAYYLPGVNLLVGIESLDASVAAPRPSPGSAP